MVTDRTECNKFGNDRIHPDEETDESSKKRVHSMVKSFRRTLIERKRPSLSLNGGIQGFITTNGSAQPNNINSHSLEYEDLGGSLKLKYRLVDELEKEVMDLRAAVILAEATAAKERERREIVQMTHPHFRNGDHSGDDDINSDLFQLRAECEDGCDGAGWETTNKNTAANGKTITTNLPATANYLTNRMMKRLIHLPAIVKADVARFEILQQQIEILQQKLRSRNEEVTALETTVKHQFATIAKLQNKLDLRDALGGSDDKTTCSLSQLSDWTE